MVSQIDLSQPIVEQVIDALKKGVENYQPKTMIIGSRLFDELEKLILPELKTFLILIDTDELDEEGLQLLKKERFPNDNITILSITEEEINKFLQKSLPQRSGFIDSVMSKTIETLAEGVKRCVEVATLAVERGVIFAGEQVLILSGVNEIPDTALIIEPQAKSNLLGTKIIDTICMPYTSNF
ncbi:MAG: hypothetical protein WCX83_00460 [Candidatus Cloacimonas sp.]|jgi:hypothetical protein|nr:hypothetical protein [Candidatus Cloacimonadota bacterium]